MQRDVVVFTTHKAASMFIHRQCELLCTHSGLEYHSPHRPESGFDPNRLMFLEDPQVWRTRRGCFAPVRFYVAIPDADRYQILLHLRDPRDVLVSMYFAYCYIHPGEVPPNTGYRREAAERGIDAFVLAKAGGDDSSYPGDYGTGGHVTHLIGTLPRRYQDYVDHLLGRPNVTLLRYEEMVSDYRGWLTKISRPFPLADRAGIIEALVARSGEFFPPRPRDLMTHVRQIAPGDHRRKLRPATIERLNRIFGPVLDALGYSRD